MNDTAISYYQRRDKANEGATKNYGATAAHVLSLVGYHLAEGVKAGGTLERHVLEQALLGAGWHKKPAGMLAGAMVVAFYKGAWRPVVM